MQISFHATAWTIYFGRATHNNQFRIRDSLAKMAESFHHLRAAFSVPIDSHKQYLVRLTRDIRVNGNIDIRPTVDRRHAVGIHTKIDATI